MWLFYWRGMWSAIVWGNILHMVAYQRQHAFWSDCFWCLAEGFQCKRLALYSSELVIGGSLFAFQITVCWRSLICRQFCQRGIRLISMKSKEHTTSSKFAPLRVCCILVSALPLQVSFLSSSGSSAPDLCCFSFQLGRWLQSQRCPTARNGSDENQTPRGADGAAQETRRGLWPNHTIATYNISAPGWRQMSPHKCEFSWSGKRGTC